MTIMGKLTKFKFKIFIFFNILNGFKFDLQPSNGLSNVFNYHTAMTDMILYRFCILSLL